MKYFLLFLMLFAFSCTKESSLVQGISGETLQREVSEEVEILVKFKNGNLDQTAISGVQGRVKRKVHTKSMQHYGDVGFHVIIVPEVSNAIEALKKNPNVVWATPNYKIQTDYAPNDPYYTNGSLWGLPRISAPTAWNSGNLGNQNIFVGVIDQGIKFDHPDLCGQIWTNPHDPQDGIDNDGNGYIDDMNGYDFWNNDPTVSDGSDSHGTHVAGTIGAKGNNGEGVIGVAPQVTIISAKFLGPEYGYTDDAIEAIDYMIDLKNRHGINVRVLNNSWSGGGYVQGLYDAIQRAANADILFVAAAGNNSWDNDIYATYPANYINSNVVSVASINNSNQLSYFSDWGLTTVDLAAPGEGIWSTVGSMTATYASYNGTSMAAPHVSGAAVLYIAGHPTASYSQVKSAIMSSTTPLSTLSGKCVTGGVLNVSSFTGTSPAPSSTGCVGFSDNIPPSTPGAPSLVSATNTSLNIAWQPSTDNVSVAYYWYEYKPATTSSWTSQAVVATTYNHVNLQPSTVYNFRVRAVDGNGNSSPYSPISTFSTTGTTVPPPTTSVSASLTGSESGGVHSLSWTVNAVGSPISQVVLQVKKDNGTFVTLHTASTSSSGSFSYTPTLNGKYSYRVFTQIATGQQAISNTVVLQKRKK